MWAHDTHRFAITLIQKCAHTHTHRVSKHTVREHGWRCLVLFCDSYYSSVEQLHAAPSAAAALIPLKPHQAALASLLNRRLSSTAAGSHQPRETERERDLHPAAAQPHHSHYVQIQWNLMWRMWLAISDAVYVTVKRRRVENIEQRIVEEARDRREPPVLCLLSPWVNAPVQPLGGSARPNGLMSANRPIIDQMTVCLKLVEKLGDYKVMIICINKKRAVCSRFWTELLLPATCLCVINQNSTRCHHNVRDSGRCSPLALC